MELDDMQRAWHAVHQRLDQQTALTGQLIGEVRGHAARAGLRPLWASQIAQLLCAFALNIVIARSWLAHADQAAAIIGGVLLQAWSVALAISALRQLQLVSQLDFAGPLLQTQQALAQLRRWRTRVAPWLGIAFWVLWVAVADSLWRMLTGMTLPHSWLLINVLVGCSAPSAPGSATGDCNAPSIRGWNVSTTRMPAQASSAPKACWTRSPAFEANNSPAPHANRSALDAAKALAW